jgi:hypothetical protein
LKSKDCNKPETGPDLETLLGFPADVERGIEVTVKVCSSIGEMVREHTACRFP